MHLTVAKLQQLGGTTTAQPSNYNTQTRPKHEPSPVSFRDSPMASSTTNSTMVSSTSNPRFEPVYTAAMDVRDG
ncbi:hypothetical protein L6452_21909 [Arctium lappa]|uniref:Uncharacterized protein n=1 Tax=Arctium lappa TaxID=4217 RepID=A0ACB9AXR1_ARCLA|nr:hypothetical protein L6452_21909 [Arctium lappa]